MDSGRPITLRGEGDEYDLGSILGSLKARGCSVLVAGFVPLRATQTVSRRLFGHPEERRERVLVRLRPTPTLDGWLPGDVGHDDQGVRILDCTAPGRSAAENESGFDDVRWHSKFDPAEIPSLSRRSDVTGCVDEIDAVAAEARPLTPAQLRVGVYSLGVLDGHDEMIDFVSEVSSTVTGHRGMVHYHLERPATSATAQTLLEHVDAMITVHKDSPHGPALQRWTVPGYGESPWVPLRRFE